MEGKKRVSCILRESVWSTDRMYDYLVPENLSESSKPGMYVEVPFGKGNRPVPALIMSVSEEIESTYPLKDILRIIDPYPVLNEDQIALMDFIRFRYTCTYADVLKLLVPAAVSKYSEKTQQVAFLKDREKAEAALEEGKAGSLSAMYLLEALLEWEEIPVRELMQMLSISKSPIDTLRKKGWIDVEKRTVQQIEAKEDEKEVYRTEPHELTEKQKDALSAILQSKKREFLLYGVTGSGKTEIYLQAAQEVLHQGGSVLFLVPEISLTPQMIRWIKSRFSENVSVLHSRLTPSEKYEQWDSIRKNKTRIVVGARSAVFAPLYNLKLILVDEEQDTSYKSETHPRYHVRDIVRKRAALSGATVVLGSATPSIETFFSAKEGYSELLCLPERAFSRANLPDVSIVDMREELRAKNHSVISSALYNEMERALSRKEQILLFLNKRGYSGMILCRSCGETVLCDHCSVPLHLHKSKRVRDPLLVCHYCGKIHDYPQKCPSCESTLIGKVGLGTQQLEEMVRETFPEARVLRMDQDTTVKRGAHEDIIRTFRDRQADILIGTQMIAKGHDFPYVTVVGVISADLLLRVPNFRAQERGFQLLTQAAGRAGRGKLPGKVFFQAYQPKDDILLYAAQQNYEDFYENELEFRKRLNYPPFKAFGSVQVSHQKEEEANKQILDVRQRIFQILDSVKKTADYQVYDPAPAELFRLRDKYRFRLFIKANTKSELAALFRALQDFYFGKGLLLQMDIDPVF